MRTRKFMAGAAMADITPPLGTVINGDFMSHYAYFVHDPLYAKALVLKNHETEIVFIVVDTCIIPKEFVDSVKGKIYEKTGIPSENILISSTHTHAAGSLAPVLLGAGDVQYRNKVRNLIPKAVYDAYQNLKEAKIAFGKVDAPEHVVCRRYFMKDGYRAYNPVSNGYDIIKTNPMGDERQIVKRENRMDTEVSYLAVKGLDGAWISVLANYSMHYVGDWENGVITADYFGTFSKAMKSLLKADEHFVGIMSNGTSGDANIMDFVNPNRYTSEYFKKNEFIGNDIAQKVFDNINNLQWDSDPHIGSSHNLLPISVRKPAPGEYAEALELVAGTRYDHLTMKESSHTGNEDAFRRIYAREQVLLHEYPDEVQAPIQAFRIGSGVIGSLPAEIFAETGLLLKKNCRVNNYFTICLSNGCLGYVPPEHEFVMGGYETWRARSSFLEFKAEEKMRLKLLDLIKGFAVPET